MLLAKIPPGGFYRDKQGGEGSDKSVMYQG